MKIVMTASEMMPYAKTGGLADVIGTLPYALSSRGHTVSVFIPFYSCITQTSSKSILDQKVWVGRRSMPYSIIEIEQREKVTVYGIRQDEYFRRPYLYGPPDQEYEDNAERFAFFSQAVFPAIQALDLRPQILHAHDWHTGLLPVYASWYYVNGISTKIPTVFTIHNLAYQGIFPSAHYSSTNLPEHLFSIEGLEFYGQVNFMKGGILYSDAVTTVSPRYAQEIQTPQYGHGLEGVLASRRNALRGIINGVDYSAWNPSTDPYLARKYTLGKMTGKASCKKALASQFGLFYSPDTPVLGIVSRFAQQKGMDLLMRAIPEILKRNVHFVILGNGDPIYERIVRQLAAQFPGQIGLRIGYDDLLAHQIYAGSDFFLMPSLYEPCGLSQLYALRYGSIPIVRATGGLDDTVQEWDPQTKRGTGFKFYEPRPDALVAALDRALTVYRKPRNLSKLIRNAMTADFSWGQSAMEYEKLYLSLQSHA